MSASFGDSHGLESPGRQGTVELFKLLALQCSKSDFSSQNPKAYNYLQPYHHIRNSAEYNLLSFL